VATVMQRLDRFSRKTYGIGAEELLARLEKGESGGRKNAKSSAGARGWLQFMPGTRAAVIQKYGIDPWRTRGEAREAAAHHLLGDLGHRKGLAGYNPGGGQSYVNYILGQKGAKIKRTKATAAGATTRTVTDTLPGGPVVDRRAALRAALASGRKNVLLEAQRNVASGAFTTTTPGEKRSRTVRERAATTGTGGSVGGQTQGLTPAIKGAVRGVSGVFGEPLTVTSGHRPGARTTSGNVSDHASGNGADIGATGDRLTRLGQAALVWAGMSPKKARRTKGGAFTFTKNGRRVQIIFNSNVGGNHYDHLHVGVA
jgi:hypothetical protein